MNKIDKAYGSYDNFMKETESQWEDWLKWYKNKYR